MEKLGFCGLGLMGAPMARRLLESGHDVVVWNRTKDKAEPLVGAGAGSADSPRDAATGVDAVITMLSTPEVVSDAVLGDDGIARGISPGAALIEMSTIGPKAAKEVAGALPDGVEMIDAPVLGSTPQAEDGTLTIFVGAPKATFERLKDIFEVFGDPVHVGPFGAGAATKLVVNSTLGALQLAVGEALALSDSLGLDPTTTFDILEHSAVGGTVKRKRTLIESGVYPPSFKLSLAVKDQRLVVDSAAELGLELPGAAAALAALEAAERDGLGDRDYSAVVAHITGRPAGAE